MSSPQQRGQEACVGNVTVPQMRQAAPMRRGSSAGHVNNPSATGTALGIETDHHRWGRNVNYS
jgi:hypothetical protein